MTSGRENTQGLLASQVQNFFFRPTGITRLAPQSIEPLTGSGAPGIKNFFFVLFVPALGRADGTLMRNSIV